MALFADVIARVEGVTDPKAALVEREKIVNRHLQDAAHDPWKPER